MSLSPSDVKKQITDPRKFVESLGYTGDIITEGRGIKIRCPSHEDKGRPNLQLSLREDGTLSVHCFVCHFRGDVYHYAEKFLGLEWKDAHARLQALAGDAPVVPRDKDDYPPPDEVCRFWDHAHEVERDTELCAQLRSRGIEPGRIRDLARAVPEVGWNPKWAWAKGESGPVRWPAAGYRLLVAMYSERGQLVTVHGRRFQADDPAKGRFPSKCFAKGAMMLNPTALRSESWANFIIVEGVPNWLVLAAEYPERPVIGLVAGSLHGVKFERIPRGASGILWTDTDQDKKADGSPRHTAGQHYRAAALALLHGRRVRVVDLPVPAGAKKAPDANDVFLRGDLAQVLDAAVAITVPASSQAARLWEMAPGLCGWSHPFLDVGRLDDMDLVRLHDGKPIAAHYNEFGEISESGWHADALGLHWLRTGEAPAAGVLCTDSLENFMALAAYFEAGRVENDDPTAPAVIAGPPPAACEKLTLWPAQPCGYDHDRILASDPYGAAEKGGHAIASALSSAQAVRAEKPIPPPDDKPPREFPPTDTGNAERLAYVFGQDIRFVGDWNQFLIWDGQRWARDRTFEIQRRATYTARMMTGKWALESESAGKQNAMCSMVRSQPGIPILPESMDADKLALNIKNGTVDLRTGRLLPHDRRQLITKLAPVTFSAGAKCPRWLAFLHRIFDGNENIISFVQRAAGYSLTGEVSEHVLFLLFGTGRNGKSTFISVMQSLLGDYAKQASPDMLMGNGDKLDAGQLSGIASLHGARFVAAAETEEGGKLGEAACKRITKGDLIPAKYMGKDMFFYFPTHKTWLATNHKPKTRSSDRGLWSMLIPIPFEVTIPDLEIDRTLPARLHAELSGILNWAIEGALQWQRIGLDRPPEIDDAVSKYKAEMDQLAPFLDECCIMSGTVAVAAINTAYEMWCADTGRELLRGYKHIMNERFKAGSDGRRRWREGVTLKAEWQGRVEARERERY